MRTSDLQLLAVAWGAAVVVTLAAIGGGRRRRPVGALALIVALAAAVRLDRALVHALPEDSLDHVGALVVPIGAAVVVAGAARRVPVGQPPRPPLVVVLAGASLVGVWLGVPETSAALLGFGVLAGVAAVLVVRWAALTRRAGVVVALVPVGATVVGAVGNRHALIGGLLCSATVVLLGCMPPRGPVQSRALVAGAAVHLASAVVAARHIGVARAWDGAVMWIPVSLVLAAVAAAVLGRGALPAAGSRSRGPGEPG